MLAEDLNKMALKMREERLKVRNPGKDIRFNRVNYQKGEESNKGHVEYTNDIEKGLAELKNNEPTSDNQFFRMCIASYEFGDLHRSIVYSERFKNDQKIRAGHLANGKLALADLLTQLNLLCMTQEWDFEGLRRLGLEHLRERHQDFKRDGWSEIAGKDKDDEKEDDKKEDGENKDNKKEDDKKDGTEGK